MVGAGKMSRLLFKHMAAKGCTQAVLLNRSLPRAQAMAEEFPQVLSLPDPMTGCRTTLVSCSILAETRACLLSIPSVDVMLSAVGLVLAWKCWQANHPKDCSVARGSGSAIAKSCACPPQISFDIRLMDQLLPSVAECDTIFAASSSEHVLLSKADVRLVCNS